MEIDLFFLQYWDFRLGRDRAVKTTHKTIVRMVCEVQKMSQNAHV